jgi:chitinase
MDDLSPGLFSELTKVKERNKDLKIIVALGGWTFNDNETATQPVFSTMVSTESNRARFISNLISFLRKYAIDGVDFDWVIFFSTI